MYNVLSFPSFSFFFNNVYTSFAFMKSTQNANFIIAVFIVRDNYVPLIISVDLKS